MAQPATILLSETGLKVLGQGVFGLPSREQRGVSGTLVDYNGQGIWFQDSRLESEGKIVLIKWDLIDAILSDLPAPEPSGKPRIGFHTSIPE